MLAPNWMELLVLVGTGGVGAAVLIYLVLRMFVWNKAESKSLERISKHAFWTGFIAWAFSSLAGANRAGLYSPHQMSDPLAPNVVVPVDPWSTIPVSWLIGPVVAVLLVHLIGQLSWPAPKSARRVAVLEYRKVRDYVQPLLGWSVFCIFAATAIVLIILACAPGFPARPAGRTGEGMTLLPLDGRIPGWMLATVLGAALVVLATGTLLVMRLTASRRSLEALNPEQNKTLRAIGMNRLLRVSATVASGLAAIAGNYLAQPAPASVDTSWTNWLGLVNMAVLVTMFFWKPPALQPDTPYSGASLSAAARPGKASFGATKLMDSTAVVLVPAAAAGVLLGYGLRYWLGWMGTIALSLAFMVLAYLALEMVLARNYGAPVRLRSGGRPPLKAPLPRWVYGGFGLSALGLAAAIGYAAASSTSLPPRRWDGFPAPWAIYVVPCILAAAILLAGLAAMWFALARPQLNNVPEALDATLRRRSLFRIARTVTSCWFALAGVVFSMAAPPLVSHPPAMQLDLSIVSALCFALGAIVLFLPVRAYTPEDMYVPDANKPSMSK
ncbi:hypothetical protein JOF48_002069 [Arthrobacter stackebrandtii]|uniref:ABC transporter permease n=1 Tax=Arthrobacter stackebrandtii TaxID=272161 RepID=A0ABS4YXT6_9MICC|nr:hypothetical protein [Arthrobacter stackebrandtii]MBP2413270.1 hypothetical protein [Arthrobacter stackebrandtii]PYH00987.1 hypothetical protein CVV67_05080 [Arthrobacter stackebrandtii]